MIWGHCGVLQKFIVMGLSTNAQYYEIDKMPIKKWNEDGEVLLTLVVNCSKGQSSHREAVVP